jgi:hypothetical protein
MKGTLFSADFVKDTSGSLRLLELNTDTAVSKNNLDFFIYDEFINILSSNSITKVTVIHKPDLHKEIVNHLSSSISENASFITDFVEVKEAGSTIYPTVVEDEENTFILRLAYDESAIFDSSYAKGTLNTLKLFHDNDSSNLITEFYHSSSIEGHYDTITNEFNPNTLPDFVVKDHNDVEHSYLKFYKVGSEVVDESNISRWDNFKSNIESETNVIQKYHYSSDTITDNKTSSFRTYSIVYGPTLSLCHLSIFEQYSPFELPENLLFDVNSYVNQIDSKHYYEFATNVPKLSSTLDGILNTHKILMNDDSYKELGDVQVGELVKSYYINGVDITQDDVTYLNWSSNGSELPSGSFVTSSAVVYKNSRQLTDKALSKLTINDGTDELYTATNKSFLVYDSGSDSISWTLAMHIDPSNDYLLDYDGDLAQVSENNFLIVNEDDFTLTEIDVEDTDTFIISGSTNINSYVVHNAPCFVQGTKITLGDGTQSNIEDVKVGDEVSTYDFKTNTTTHNKVNNVFSKVVKTIVKYTFDNEETLLCTIDHPIYVEDKGWCSYNSQVSNSLYKLETSVNKIEIGDNVRALSGTKIITDINVVHEDTTVYNLQDIEVNHNFYANQILVHNRKY